MDTLTNLTATQLRRAAEIKDKIEALQKELSKLVGSTPPAAAEGRKGNISAAGIARIKAAQKARWAAQRAKSRNSQAKRPAGKRPLTAEGRARLSALAKARWAKVKAAGKKAL